MDIRAGHIFSFPKSYLSAASWQPLWAFEFAFSFPAKSPTSLGHRFPVKMDRIYSSGGRTVRTATSQPPRRLSFSLPCRQSGIVADESLAIVAVKVPDRSTGGNPIIGRRCRLVVALVCQQRSEPSPLFFREPLPQLVGELVQVDADAGFLGVRYKHRYNRGKDSLQVAVGTRLGIRCVLLWEQEVESSNLSAPTGRKARKPLISRRKRRVSALLG